jgi:competence protein ComEA
VQLPQISRNRALAYIAALLLGLTLAGRTAFRGDDQRAAAKTPSVPLRAEAAPVRKLLVHVVGAVRRPGLYRLDEGSRIDDAVRAAGGAKPRADLQAINLAAPVADGQQIAVPVRGRGAGGAEAALGPGKPPGQPVHLNTATLEELDSLPGIGPVTAQKILDYRTEHGAFASVDELDAVPGIGPARLAELKKVVQL